MEKAELKSIRSLDPLALPTWVLSAFPTETEGGKQRRQHSKKEQNA
jgi:hypothetical protein